MGLLTEVGLFSAKLLWESSKLAVVYTPKIIIGVAQLKREIVEAIEDELAEKEKAAQEELLEQQIEEQIELLKKRKQYINEFNMQIKRLNLKELLLKHKKISIKEI